MLLDLRERLATETLSSDLIILERVSANWIILSKLSASQSSFCASEPKLCSDR